MTTTRNIPISRRTSEDAERCATTATPRPLNLPWGNGRRCPPSSAVSGGWGGRREEGAASYLLFPDDPIDCDHRRHERKDNDDVSPCDILNFPSFVKFDSPSRLAKCGAGVVVVGGGVENDNDDRPPTRSPPSLVYNFPQPPPSTTRKMKAHYRQRILNLWLASAPSLSSLSSPRAKTAEKWNWYMPTRLSTS